LAAVLLMDQGRLAEAREKLHELMRFHGEGDEPKSLGMDLTLLAKVQLLQGDLEGAKGKLHKAQAILGGTEAEYKPVQVWAGQGWAALLQGDRAEARRWFERAMQAEQKKAEGKHSVDAQIGLTVLDLGEGDAAKLEAKMRGLLEQEPPLPPVLLGPVHVALAMALLTQGRLQEAQAEALRVEELCGRSESYWIRWVGELAVARVRGASGQAEEARRGVERALEAAGGTGSAVAQMELRLLLGELELQSGDLEAGRRRLEELEREARAKGYGLIAERAARALQAKPA
jgi:ATP/maltotriose-dependent transcriptional regulator MalT